MPDLEPVDTVMSIDGSGCRLADPSRQETMALAVTYGLGVLSFGFFSLEETARWTREYYETLKSCRPLTYRVNANVASLSYLMCHRDGTRARRRGG